MHLHFERNVNTKCDCTILSLSWMGKVPEDIPEDEGWKLNRTNYYQEGWLATGNIRGIVGVTFTTSHCRKNMDCPLRTNYNLRGHRSDVILVKWNEPYQKLASCDSSGIIFVWIKYEGRWSIELINDRNTPVTHFSWSHDGRMALICYQDGFVLVGSVAGQRYWSSMLNLESTITCGIWTPDDQQVYFGTTQGQVIVMDVHGAMVSQVQLCSDVGITSMAWSCEKFKMEEGEETSPGVTNASKRSFVLAVCFQNGFIYLLKSFDDVSPAHINTGLNGALCMVMEWSNSREVLAVAGTSNKTIRQADNIYENTLKFYSEAGILLYTVHIPDQISPVSALTWGHNDKRLFIATGTHVHIAWVSRRVASLQLLCRLQIQASIESEDILPLLPLPSRIKSLIANLYAQTIRCCVPDAKSLRVFVSRPPALSTRLHCTMIRHDDDSNLSSGTCYTLYLEYLGGLVPLLKGKRTSKIRPEFVIFDPQISETSIFFQYSTDSKSSSGSSQSTTTANSGRTDSSDSEYEDHCVVSPRTPRKRQVRQTRSQHITGERITVTSSVADLDNLDELAYVDTLPEEVKLVEVTSNIWGTKFKIHGLSKTVPANLGQVTYKTSLLHLQPRQMTLVLTELRDDFAPGPDPYFNPNIFSEDEDEGNVNNKNQSTAAASKKSSNSQTLNDNLAPPIAPMSPIANCALPHNKNSLFVSATNTSLCGISPLARAESYEDESSNESQELATSNLANISTNSVSQFSADPSLSSTNGKPKRPNNIASSSTGQRLGPSHIKYQNGRSLTSSSCQSRHAISPLYCDGSLPTLQSPKNAVAPSDIIFERPPISVTGQTTLMSYSTHADYKNNVVQVKNALMTDYMRTNSCHVNTVSLNQNLNLERMDTAAMRPLLSTTILSSTTYSNKRKDGMLYIDEEMQSPIQSVAFSSTHMKRTSTLISIAPALPNFMTRSCSAGYLDSVVITPSDEALTALRKDAPNKRLILIDNRRNRKKRVSHEDMRKPRLHQCGKSKSFDSCDLYSMLKPSSAFNTENARFIKKLDEIIENSTCRIATTTLCSKCRKSINTNERCKPCQVLHEVEELPITALHNSRCSPVQKPDGEISATELNSDLASAENNKLFDIFCEQPSQKNVDSTHTPVKKKLNVITSFTDSPLFTRKHRFGTRHNKDLPSRNLSPTVVDKKRENGFSLVKHLSEVRWRRRETQNNVQSDIDEKHESSQNAQNASTFIANGNTIEATRLERRASVSLHTQALTTLENIIGRLRDLDEGRLTPPGTPQRLPRSSPSSPAAIKKNKRHQSSSPIRHILNSPLLNPRQRKKTSTIESSDDEGNLTTGSGDESSGGHASAISGRKQYRDLETFQKAQLRQKLKRGRIEPNGSAINLNPATVRREFVMHNKAPMWNEMSQVYQLDFGGRVTQESAKNFQIEFRGKQVMQFGRIDGNAYTLDFQYPFSAVQAFAVALANVTQRLK